MERAQAEGRDPEEELRQVVSRTVFEGVLTGFEMSTDTSPKDDESPSKKRPRRDDGPVWQVIHWSIYQNANPIWFLDHDQQMIDRDQPFDQDT